MSMRVLSRMGAREMSPEQMDQIGHLHTLCGVPPHFFRDDFSIP